MNPRLPLVTAFCVALLGCHSPGYVTSRVSAFQKLDEARLYHEASSTVWDDYKVNTRFEARVITLTPRLVEAPDDAPISHLTIKNLTTGRTILQKDIDYRPLSIHFERLIDDRSMLVTEWVGATARGIMIFSVDRSGARIVLDEGYRLEA